MTRSDAGSGSTLLLCDTVLHRDGRLRYELAYCEPNEPSEINQRGIQSQVRSFNFVSLGGLDARYKRT